MEVCSVNKNNNLFTYATSELSQDAFLCWLFSYAMEDADDEPTLKECAIDFIRQFIPDLNKEDKIWISEPPRKQYKSIDILLTVNDKYKVIIEDKTYTSEHDDQLKRYLNDIKNDFYDYIPIGVYFKTGFQSNLSNVKENKYLPFGREQILSTIERYTSKTDNIIFHSYYETIKSFDNEIKGYKYLPVSDWKWSQINGFYDSIKKDELVLQGMVCDYGYVANQSGGFYGMWLGNDSIYEYNGNDYELYLQCEFTNGNLKICYKVSNKSGEVINKNAREYFIWRKKEKWIDIADNNGFKKPSLYNSRYGCGKTVTLGFYEFDSSNLDCNSAKIVLVNAIKSFKKTIKELMEES